ncbi:MAG: 50S ribosomal protein L25/general stress protein Ctc [Gammaproteobacteria bacterium]|nr:50S ribosomal protein L25/general stress protein Ctc [Gammaproteobacteria bacterium]MCY4210737.1 50S ribosomal protein L25/general stress protein Ctc [Gammaproteobacteria bacterium]MCY4281814.1 50S ribosomal protein L25/general stress protein Ctc [Gammaproteobacteria bacterium]MCY4339564.1 50S ribosomal protein L25/general stress protein Ctc [Gammaproteobacteria bacterium]
MQVNELKAEPRNDRGKSASRRLRRSGRIPGIVYGAGKDPQSISLVHDDVLHRLDREVFYSSILTLNVDTQSERVVVKDLQRHPFKPDLLHIDFLRIDEKQKISMRVPLHFVNEHQCVGVKADGGVISHIMTELEISCLPADLPEYIDVDMAQVHVGESVHLSDIVLPEGVEIYALLSGGDASASVATVSLPKGTMEEEEMEQEEEELEATEETPAEEQ